VCWPVEDALRNPGDGLENRCVSQLPAFCSTGPPSVVSPLIALMKDQLDMLAELGVTSPVALNSTLSEDQELRAMERHRLRSDEDRLRHAREARTRRVRGDPGEAAHPAVRRRRSALHLAMGARTSGPATSTSAKVINQWGIRPYSPHSHRNAAVREDILMQLGIPNVKPGRQGFDRRTCVMKCGGPKAKPGKTQDPQGALSQGRTRRHRNRLHGDDQERARSTRSTCTTSWAAARPSTIPKLQKHDRTAVHEGGGSSCAGSDSGRRRDQRLRLGDRQAEHSLRRALRFAGFGRSVHAGSRTRRPRRRPLEVAC